MKVDISQYYSQALLSRLVRLVRFNENTEETANNLLSVCSHE